MCLLNICYFKDILSQDNDESQSKSCKEEKKYPEDVVNCERLGSVSKTILYDRSERYGVNQGPGLSLTVAGERV